jgi:hypothetical protein
VKYVLKCEILICSIEKIYKIMGKKTEGKKPLEERSGE